MYGNWGYGAGFGFGWIFMVIFWGLIIWGIISLVRHGGFGGHGCCGMGGHGEHKQDDEKKNNSALDILKERYAKGEINKQEYEEKKKDLSN